MKLLILWTAMFLAACAPYSTTQLTGATYCPHPYAETLKAQRFVKNVYEVDGLYMSAMCARNNTTLLLGCTLQVADSPTKYAIYILNSGTQSFRNGVYRHELCHVYESEYLGRAGTTAAHIGWATEEQ